MVVVSLKKKNCKGVGLKHCPDQSHAEVELNAPSVAALLHAAVRKSCELFASSTPIPCGTQGTNGKNR